MLKARTSLITLLGLLLIAGRVLAETPQQIDIPPGELSEALIRLSKQYGVDLFYRPEQVRGIRTEGVSGELTTEQAVIRLIEGTALEVSRDATGAMVIGVKGEKSARGSKGEPSSVQSAVRGAPLRLAQGEGGKGKSKEAERAADENAGEQLEEIVVTGTHIRNASTGASPVIVLDRKYIERSGVSTMNQLFDTVPQNFTGGAGEDDKFSALTSDNISYSSTIDLRGLGADSTLILLNGRRMAPAGSGGFVDTSAIPLAALDRVEILTDGASAIYGADAIAGVVNFVLLKDYEGAATKLRLGSLTNGGGDELQASQVFGRRWNSGSALLSYEFYRREPLAVVDRPFVANPDKRLQGGSDFRVTTCFPGTIRLFDGRVFGIPAGQDGTDLTEADLSANQPNLCENTSGASLLPRQERHSVFLNTTADLTGAMSLYLDGLYSRREAVATVTPQVLTLLVRPTNAFRQVNNLFPAEFFVPVEYSVAGEFGYPRSETTAEAYNVATGVDIELGSRWTVDAGLSVGSNTDELAQLDVPDAAAIDQALRSSDQATAFNPFAGVAANSPALLASLLTDVRIKTVGKVASGRVLAQGSGFWLAGREVRLAVGSEYRDESFEGLLPKESRHVSSLFAEGLLPLIRRDGSQGSVSRLDLSIAARAEHYSDFGSTEVGKAGLIWQPVAALALRGTYGNSFKAPLLRELFQPSQLASTFLPGILDPRTDDALVPVILRFGGNRDLTPEEATTWTLGSTYQPEFISRGRLELTYVNTVIDDRIAAVTNIGTIFANEDALTGAGAFVRGPSQAIIDALAANSDRIDIFGPPLQEGSVAIAIDSGLRNIAKVRLEALDLNAEFGMDTSAGQLDFNLGASYLLNLKEAIVRGAPLQQRADTFANPMDLRVRGGVTWGLNGWRVAGFVNYSDSYTDNRLAGQTRKVDSWSTADLTASYSFPDGTTSAFLHGASASLVMLNAFDEKPPFVNIAYGYDAANADPAGRSVAVTFEKRW